VVSYHCREVFEGRQFGATQAQSFWRKSKDHSPELFARVRQCSGYHRSCYKHLTTLRVVSRRAGNRLLCHSKIVAGSSDHCKFDDRSKNGAVGYGRKLQYAWRNMSESAAPAIEFRNVSFRVADTQVLSELSLQVARGETLVLLGRSGSGKTTTLKLVNRLVSPTSGEIRVNGSLNTHSDVTRLRRGIGYVIQDAGLFPHFTVERNIGLVPKIEGWPKDRIRARTQELLQLVGLAPEIAMRYPHQLSGGQRQRVGVARALAADPEILLMDEPFAALDPLTRDDLQREFLLLQQRLHKTVVFVTHDLREALRLGSRIALMEAGKLVTVLPPKQFVKSSDPWAAAYVRAFGDGLDSATNRGTS
jgi:osmoprotectant transport system ATP-binding protein